MTNENDQCAHFNEYDGNQTRCHLTRGDHNISFHEFTEDVTPAQPATLAALVEGLRDELREDAEVLIDTAKAQASSVDAIVTSGFAHEKAVLADKLEGILEAALAVTKPVTDDVDMNGNKL